MIDRAIVYLESKDMAYADPTFYLRSDKYDYAGISLDIVKPDGVAISVSSNDPSSKSPTIVLGSTQEDLLEPILDLLIFSIKNGRTPND